MMSLIQRLEEEVDSSECAVVKRLYFQRSDGIVGPTTDSDFSSILRLCRVIVADERVLWEYIGPSFTDVFSRPVDAWNEQLAVKLLRTRLEGTPGTEGLLEALCQHTTETLKPTVVTKPSVPHLSLGSPFVIVPASCENDDRVEGSLICGAPLCAFGNLLRVPRERMFFIETVKQYCALGRAVHSSLELSAALSGEEQLLVLALIYERFVVGPDASHWGTLLVSCPSAYPTMPGFWDWEDLAELEGLDVLDDVLAKRAQLARFHSEIVLILPHIYATMRSSCLMDEEEFIACFTTETIMWARATFDSRAFNLNIDGHTVLALVPLADMINHDNRSDVLVRRVEPDGGDFVMQIGAPLTDRDIGRELWMSYGPLQNWELLEFYGFVMEDNEHDKLPFPINIPVETSDEWDRRRIALVNAHALHLAGRCWIGYNGKPPEALCALLRVYLADAEDFDAMERYGPFAPVGEITEQRILDTIAKTVECILSLSGSTLEEDEELLRSTGSDALTTNGRLAILLRVGLKRIARRTMEWCDRAAREKK